MRQSAVGACLLHWMSLARSHTPDRRPGRDGGPARLGTTDEPAARSRQLVAATKWRALGAQLLHQLLEDLPAAVLLFDSRTARVRYANRAARGMVSPGPAGSGKHLARRLARWLGGAPARALDPDALGIRTSAVYFAGRRYQLAARPLAGRTAAVAVVLMAQGRDSGPSLDAELRRLGLTARERGMVALVRAGHDNLAIATALGLRRSTVKQYLHLIYTAVGVRSRGELRLALQEMLAAPDGGGVSDG